LVGEAFVVEAPVKEGVEEGVGEGMTVGVPVGVGDGVLMGVASDDSVDEGERVLDTVPLGVARARTAQAPRASAGCIPRACDCG
jgi:hypothetical protein